MYSLGGQQKMFVVKSTLCTSIFFFCNTTKLTRFPFNFFQKIYTIVKCLVCCGTELNIYADDTQPPVGTMRGDICNIEFKCSDTQGNVLGSLEFPWCPGPLCCQGYPFELYIGDGPNRRHLHAESSIICLPWTFDVINEQGQIEMRIEKQLSIRDQMVITVDPADRILPILAFLVGISIDVRYFQNNNNNNG
jgi:hypothetical protein